jgi:hypothetical protein
VLVREHHLDLAQPREDFRRQLELERSEMEVRVLRVVGMVAARMTGHELLDLPQVLSECAVAPSGFATRCRHARELANRRERQVAGIQRCFEQRERFERTRDPQALQRRVRRVAQDSLHVVDRRDHPELAPDLQPFCFAKPTRFLCVERGSPRCDVAQVSIHRLPVINVVECQHRESVLHP